ncbi:NRPS [Recurvomyces mirabilis]|uniref:NRPS n=1 Tax=Recurvomyces mirabilis TaxID=574656 RepID=A0AAE0WP24_9PEZI|nr:NRPS [Recurvomyces mirabilis]KAK5157935.1 hypothetical protein LTS14_003858 [Recurvomyces mirabilis]
MSCVASPASCFVEADSPGADQDAKQYAARFWQQYFDALDAQPFPSLPSMGFRPIAKDKLEHAIESIRWPAMVRSGTVVRAAWSAIAAKHTGIAQALFGIGTSVEDSSSSTDDDTAIVPMQVRVDGEETIRDFLSRVDRDTTTLQKRAVRIDPHVLRAISTHTDHACHFQTLLLQASSDVEGKASTHALVLIYSARQDGLHLNIAFDPRILDVEFVQRMVRQLEHVLRLFCNPDLASAPLSTIDLVSPHDLSTIWSWNATVPEPLEMCVHDLIAETTRAQPDCPAVCAWDGDLTYTQLDQLSTRLAHHLVSTLGIVRTDIVPLCFEKSMWTSVAILAVVKAGAACVTMDTTHPEAHLRRIIQQTSARVILTSSANEKLAATLADESLLVLRPEALLSDPHLSVSVDSTDLPTVYPHDRLYVVFTSGSTGTPKGATITHTNFSSAIKHQQGPLGMTSSSRVFDYVSYAFDVSWLNSLLTFATGACLCVPNEAERRNDLASSIRRLDVNYADLTPSISRLLDAGDVPSLMHLTFGGEEVLAEDVSRWQNIGDVVNGYGPAECTPKSMAYNYTADGSSKLANQIGAGTGLNTWVVEPDNESKLSIIGAIGELWLEGPLVGAGYLGDREKTAAAFFETLPWLDQSKESSGRGRVYRTGDLVRYNPDGSLVYVRRKDQQVKVRGHRVELAEIEHHIRSSGGEGVNVVAEMVTPRGSSDKVLVAFLATMPSTCQDDGRGALASRMRHISEGLKSRVPSYMIPGGYIGMDRIPMSATGKADHRKLREIASQMTMEELVALNRVEYREPTTACELRLQALWASVLGISPASIGLDDSFLLLGGDSITAMRLAREARRAGIPLAVATILKNPVLADLATLLGDVSGPERVQEVGPFTLLQGLQPDHIRHQAAAFCRLRPEQVEDAFPCTPMQEGLLALTSKRSGDFVARYILKVSADAESFQSTWNHVVHTTPILRTRIVDLAGISSGVGLVQVIVDEPVSWHRSSCLDQYVMEDQQRDIGLGTPLISVALVDDAKRGRLFVWTIHHALYDGWSMQLMMDRMRRAYNGAVLQTGSPFQSFVKTVVDGDRTQAQSLWRTYFQGIEASPFPALPSATYQPVADQTIVSRISGIDWPRCNVTASTVVRAAWAVLVSQYTNLDEALFGVISMGRQGNVPGIEDIVGPTIAATPMRIVLDKDLKIADFLQDLQARNVEIAEVEQLGLQQIRKISTDAEQACQFQMLLNIQPNQDRLPDNVDGPLERVSLEGAIAEAAHVLPAMNTYGLMIECILHDDGIECSISFDPKLMGKTKVQRMSHQYEHILRQLSTNRNAAKRLADVNFISSEDLHTIWAGKTAAPEAADDDVCVHNLITAHVLHQPNSPAICAWDGELTYRELDRLSTNLAQYLIGQNVCRGTVVPLCFEKSRWAPVAVLGTMKAGAAGMLIDCTLPKDRLLSIVSQVKPVLCLALASTRPLAQQLLTVPVLPVDQFLSDENETSLADRPLPVVDAAHLLYVVFTSGSTGVPKGALITHRSFCSAVKHQANVFNYSSETRKYGFASYSFDAAWFEMLHVLVAGGCLCIPSEKDRKDDITGSYLKLSANTLGMPPSTARLLDPGLLPGLRSILLGGEPATAADFARWPGSIDRFNVYGPAECVPPVAISRHNGTVEDVPYIGSGQGVNLWLVDPRDYNKLAAVGAVGEVLIEGPLVGEGYLNNEALTRELFIHDPIWMTQGISGVPGRRSRLYKSGDLMKYGEHGQLIFVSRKDAQVKINGQRFELSDVEEHIRQTMETPEDAHVLAETIIPSNGSRSLLVAFVCLTEVSGNDQDDQSKLRAMVLAWNAQLRDAVPGYMIPSAYIPVSRFPMTATGKANRRQLREIGHTMTLEALAALNPSRREYRRPTRAMEVRMQTMWANTLGIDAATIGLDDSFLQIGGDSIAAMRLVRAARESGVSLTVADIFKQPVLSELADLAKDSASEIQLEQELMPFSLLKNNMTPAQVRSQAATMCGVQVDCIEDVFPCTPLQEGLLSLTAKRPGDYTARFILQLRPEVDIEKFRAAWELVLRTTPILRTQVVDLSCSGLAQVILTEARSWEEHDSLDQYIGKDRKREFGLGRSLTHSCLVRDAARRQNFFVWTIHHALYDGWSMLLLMDRLQLAYRGKTLPFTAPFQRFVQYITDTDRVSHAESLWSSYLEGLEASPFPALPSPGYHSTTDEMTTKDVKVTWPQGNITASTIIRAAWAIVAAQFTGEQEVVFGATVIGRQTSLAEVEQMVGPTISLVPVRVVADGSQVLSKLLHQVQLDAVEMTVAEQLGLQRIRHINTSTARASEFQTVLVIQPIEEVQDPETTLFDMCDLKDLGVRVDDAVDAFNTYGLQVICNIATDGVRFKFSYDSNQISSALMEQLGNQLGHTLGLLCARSNMSKRLADIDFACDQDLDTIWSRNASVPAIFDDVCVHDVITEAAIQQPAAPAICAWDGALSYAELDRISTRLALHLVDLGVTCNDVVPLCFEKSMWMPVAQMAVIKSGASFVGTDPSQPEERLRSIIDQTKPGFILCSKANFSMASRLATSARVVVTDHATLDDLDSRAVKTAALPATSSSNRLYVAFTSGSTGISKGAVMTHQNFTSAIFHQREPLRILPTSRVFDFASYAFDLSCANLLHTLAAGACLCVPSEGDRQTRLAESMRTLRVNYAHLTPTVARFLDPTAVPDLKTLLLVGEVLTPSDKAQWLSHASLTNTYGPTECTAFATSEPMVDNDEQVPRIGKGMGFNTWVIKPEGTPGLVPIGAVGELVLEGPLVGEGYLGQPQLSAKAFVHSPPWLVRGSTQYPGRTGRLYRTGDLVRCEPDGRLEFITRKDMQVKIRGQRVELGDIEHHVKQSLTDVLKTRIAVELIYPKQSTEPLLVAFFENKETPNPAEPTTAALISQITTEASSRLSKVVPVHMIPGAYVPLSSIPMNTTGKTDRRRLREIGSLLTLEELAAANNSSERRKPTTDMETRLQSLWASLLGIESSSIGRDDSFLQIGGDSIGAMRLVRLAAQEEGIALTVADIFKAPVLSDLALFVSDNTSRPKLEQKSLSPFGLIDELSKKRVCNDAALLCSVQAAKIQDAFPCTPLQEGLLALTARRSGDYVARFVLELRDSVKLDTFRSMWSQVVQATPILRTRIADLPGLGLTNVVVDEDANWLEHQSLSGYIARDKEDEMGLGTSLARFGLVKDSGRHFFVWTFHHAVYDNWSLQIILKRAKSAFLGQSLPSTPPFQSFVDYVTNMDKDAAIECWREYLSGLESQPFPALPSKAYRPAADKTFAWTVHGVKWPQSNVTPSVAIRAAWGVYIAQLTDADEALFSVITMGRQANVYRIEDVVGPTIATVPVRIVINKNANVSQFLLGLQEQTIRLTAVEQVGLQSIRRISPEAELACQFQTLLDVQLESEESATDGPFQYSISDPAARGNDHINAAFATYALKIQCKIRDGDLHCLATYDSQVLATEQMERIGHQFEHILRQLCAGHNSTSPMGEVDFVSAHDLKTIWSWNATVPSAENSCVHEIIGDTARRQPDAPALCAWDGDLTYHELNRYGTQVAHHLVDLGIGYGDLVPIYFEKSMWTTVAILGVMKAGAACVTMDATQPEAHLRRIVAQTSATVILASLVKGPSAARLLSGTTKVILPQSLVTTSSDVTATGRERACLPKVDPSHPLYVVFTSGSTGTPKGAIITHANFATAIKYQRVPFGMTSSSRVYDYVSYAFDVSWLNVLLTLAVGACLCVPHERERRGDLASSIRRLKVNYTDLTPSITRLLNASDVPLLRHLTFGGEEVLASDAARWGTLDEVINGYGPAECTPKSMAYNYITSKSKRANEIGVGTGLNTWVVKPDNSKQLAMVGSIGELWLEGPLVGAGYLNDKEKTDEAFIHDPEWLLNGRTSHQSTVHETPTSHRKALVSTDADHVRGGRRGRVYKTGDLVRYNPDGTLIYIRRKDQQVKVRGQRVELAEIEHHIREVANDDASINILAEMVTPKDGSQKVLVAFIAMPAAELAKMMQRLAEGLAERVPAYMIPTAYVPIDCIPMSTTGKADRRKLRALGGSMTIGELTALVPRKGEHRRPRTAIEIKLQSLFASTIGISASSIGLDDSFVEMGGDSITAMRLALNARKDGVALTVADIFRHSSLEDLARAISSGCKDVTNSLASGSVSIKPVVLTHNAQRQVQRLGVSPSTVLPVTNFQQLCIRGALRTPKTWWDYRYVDFHGKPDVARLIEACHRLWYHFDSLRLVFLSSGDRFLQTVPANSKPIIVVHETEGDAEQDCTNVCEADQAEAVSLGASFTKFILTRTLSGSVRLIIRLSHAQYDAISSQAMMQTLHAAYRREDLAPSARFQDFVTSSITQGAASMQHWRSLLRGSTVTKVPTILADSDPGMGIEVTATVPEPVSSSAATPATIFTSACAAALAKVTGLSDVVFGRVVSGRSVLGPELQNVMGACVGWVPVRVQFSGAPSATKARSSVQKQYIDGLSYEITGTGDASGEVSSEELQLCDFGCVVQYQNVDTQPSQLLGEDDCRLKFYKRPEVRVETDVSRIDILAIPSQGGWDVTITSGRHKRSELEELLREICEGVASG